MSVTRANWHTATLDLDDEPDPFEVPVEEIGTPIDLSNPTARLNARLIELLRREANLYQAGVTCAIRDRPDTTCVACPVSEHADKNSRRGVLCRNGREQERVVTELAVATLEAQCQDPASDSPSPN